MHIHASSLRVGLHLGRHEKFAVVVLEEAEDKSA